MNARYKTVVFVESSTKRDTIQSILGDDDYMVVATDGHLREIKNGLNDVDISGSFALSYSVIKHKRQFVKDLRELVANALKIILATDADREGESIAWHLCKVFRINIKKTHRVVFREITRECIERSIQQPPWTLNIALVREQQARQCIDLLLGYMITPMLWKYMCSNKDIPLSAGRCQNAALKLLKDRQEEMEQEIGEEERERLQLSGYFTSMRLLFVCTSTGFSAAQVQELLQDNDQPIECFAHTRTVYPPKLLANPKHFKTSTLLSTVQSECSSMSAKQIMGICQQLYEKGAITYTRTKSEDVCELYSQQVKTYCSKHNIPCADLSSPIKSDIPVAHAHEAIRPTHIEHTCLDGKLFTKAEQSVYAIIHKRSFNAVAQQQVRQVIDYNIKVKLRSGCEETTLMFRRSVVLENNNEFKESNESVFKSNNESVFLDTVFNEHNRSKSMLCYQMIASPLSPRVNEASKISEGAFVLELERLGIGHPSTFVYIIEKLKQREYVETVHVSASTTPTQVTQFHLDLKTKQIYSITHPQQESVKQSKKPILRITALGRMVASFCDLHFPDLFHAMASSDMERRLTTQFKAENSPERPPIDYDLYNNTYTEFCRSYYQKIAHDVEELKASMKDNKFEIEVDEDNTICVAKYGVTLYNRSQQIYSPLDTHTNPFAYCSSPTQQHQHQSRLQASYFVNKREHDRKRNKGDCNKHSRVMEDCINNKEVVLMKGKYGLYCSFDNKKYSLKQLGNRDIQNIRIEEIKNILQV